MSDLFDYVNDINQNKNYIFDDKDSQNYSVFMMNRAFMQHLDTVMIANEANKMSSLSKLMHHDFLFYSVEPKKRTGKWVKFDDSELEMIQHLQEKYAINRNVAIEYLNMVDRATIKKEINDLNMKGGLKK